MKLNSLLSEAMLFKDFHEIKVDPDRDDSRDIADKLLPLAVKMAYTQLYHDRETHERKYGPSSEDEDAYNFEFTADALSDLTEELLNHLAEKLKDISTEDIKTAISAEKFVIPLETKKK
jgi:hypothetical protein